MEGGCQTSKVNWEDIGSIKQELIEAGESTGVGSRMSSVNTAGAEEVRGRSGQKFREIEEGDYKDLSSLKKIDARHVYNFKKMFK